MGTANSKQIRICFIRVMLFNFVWTQKTWIFKHAMRTIRPELFVSQRDQRVDAGGAPRRNITSQQSHTDEKKGDTCKRQRIRRPNTVKHSGHQVRYD